MIILADLALLFALFISAYMALAWGEAGSFDVHGDKSALAGFGMVILFMGMRWIALALALLLAVRRGGFSFLPGGRWAHAAIVIGVHAVLGVVSYRGFEWITRAIQASNPAPLGWAWAFALLIPIPVFLVTLWALHRSWIPRHPVWATAVVALVVWAHVAGWRSGYQPRTRPVVAEVGGR